MDEHVQCVFIRIYIVGPVVESFENECLVWLSCVWKRHFVYPADTIHCFGGLSIRPFRIQWCYLLCWTNVPVRSPNAFAKHSNCYENSNAVRTKLVTTRCDVANILVRSSLQPKVEKREWTIFDLRSNFWDLETDIHNLTWLRAHRNRLVATMLTKLRLNMNTAPIFIHIQ